MDQGGYASCSIMPRSESHWALSAPHITLCYEGLEMRGRKTWTPVIVLQEPPLFLLLQSFMCVDVVLSLLH